MSTSRVSLNFKDGEITKENSGIRVSLVSFVFFSRTKDQGEFVVENSWTGF
jgi:hypothetical protein